MGNYFLFFIISLIFLPIFSMEMILIMLYNYYMEKVTLTPIAHIETNFKEKFGIPRQSGKVEGITGRIVFEKEYRNIDAIKELETYTYIWIIFDFSESHTKEFSPTVRPPKLGGNQRVGVFASRSPFRPNPLGLSSVRLIKIEHDSLLGPTLIVDGVDMLDGTPIFDIKPYIKADSHPDAICGYSDKHIDDHIEVIMEDSVKSVIPINIQEDIVKLISQDPRPGYQYDDRVYSMKYSSFDFHFKVENGLATIFSVDII